MGLNVPVPEWVDFPKLLKNSEIARISPFHRDNLAYLISLFITIPARNKKYRTKTGAINLNSRILQKYVHNYRQYLDFLIDAGIIMKPRQDSYIPGRFSKQYILIAPFHIDIMPPTEIEVNHNSLVKKLVKAKRHYEQRRQISYLNKWFNEGLQFDYDSAIDNLDKETVEYMKHPESWPIAKRTLKRIHPADRASYLKYAFVKLKRKDFYQFIDDSGERLHTNLTNLKKTYRKFLTYNGQNLSALDIKNSQPYFSLLLFNQKFWEAAKKPKSDGANFDLFWTNNELRSKIQVVPIIMLVESLQGPNKEELTLFERLVTTGELYEYFAMKLTTVLGRNYTREEAKKQLLINFFSANQFIGQIAAAPKKVFRDLFPNIYALFSIIKRKNKPLLACLLQQVESHVVLHITCKAIAKRFPEVPIFTIHDSIVTTETNLDFIEMVMHEEIRKFIGLPPTLSREIWNDTSLGKLPNI
jgi:hypothetical protein